MCIGLDIIHRVESTTLAARRLVRPVADCTPRFLSLAFTMAVAWLSTAATKLRFRARKGLVPDTHTTEALHRSTPGLEDTGEGRLSILVEVLAFQ